MVIPCKNKEKRVNLKKRGLKKNKMKRVYKLKSQLYERIGLSADSLKIKKTKTKKKYAYIQKKSCTQETLNLSTDAECITIATKRLKKKLNVGIYFFLRSKTKQKIGGGPKKFLVGGPKF